MKEGLFILAVVLILLAVSAVRYRKAISGMIGIARALKDAKDAASAQVRPAAERQGVQLVQCSKCGIWVPESKATATRAGKVCSTCG